MSHLRPYFPHALVAIAMLAASAVYWTGLNGPFLLDDAANLDSIGEWLDGKQGLEIVLFERAGGMFGRPVSMASFAFNAWLGGYTPFSLKLGNLIVHLLCGVAIFVLLRRVLRRDAEIESRAQIYAAVVAGLWLVHPLHASTVLYAVQRMAQLSTLLILSGLWVYLVLRETLERNPSHKASACLLILMPAITAFAFLAKENGALLLPLCAVLELTLFTRGPRPRSVRAFHLLYVVTPVCIGLLAFAWKPTRILGGYASRDFGMIERLLTQGRVLGDYITSLLLPNPPRMGIYTDDFVVSTGLLSPPSTLVALLLLLATSIAAWHLRKRFPSVTFGWFFFLVAHALEAGPIALELYFEHRNYLPSMGLLVCVICLAHSTGQAMTRAGLRPGRIGAVTLAAAMCVLIIGTQGRALVWRDRLLIAESSLASHPGSLRANVEVFSNSIDNGNRRRAEDIIASLADSELPRHRARSYIYRLFLQCVVDNTGDARDLRMFVTTSPMPLQIEDVMPFKAIINAVARDGCGSVDGPMIGNALAQLADRAHVQSDQVRPKIVSRYYAAEAYLLAKDWESALPQARLAWQINAEVPLARPLLVSQLLGSDLEGARRTLEAVESRVEPSNTGDQQALRWMRGQVGALHPTTMTP